MFEQAPGFMALLEGPNHKIAFANRAFNDLVGNRTLTGKALAEALPEFTAQGVDEILGSVARSGEAFVAHGMSLSVTRADGSAEDLLVDLVFQPLPPSEREPSAIFIQGNNITDDRRSEVLRTAHNKVLELAIGDAPLENTLSALIRIVESTSRTGVLGSILLLDADGKHLRNGAAPSLPPAYAPRSTGPRSVRARAHAGPPPISARRYSSRTSRPTRYGPITSRSPFPMGFAPAGRSRS